MSYQDPLSDFCCRIRNAQHAKHTTVIIRGSTLIASICAVLVREGYIDQFEIVENGPNKKLIHVTLRYHEGRSLIQQIKQVSKPSLRLYYGIDDLPRVKNGLGIAVLSTNRGVLTDAEARQKRVGGELLCLVS